MIISILLTTEYYRVYYRSFTVRWLGRHLLPVDPSPIGPVDLHSAARQLPPQGSPPYSVLACQIQVQAANAQLAVQCYVLYSHAGCLRTKSSTDLTCVRVCAFWMKISDKNNTKTSIARLATAWEWTYTIQSKAKAPAGVAIQ